MQRILKPQDEVILQIIIKTKPIVQKDMNTQNKTQLPIKPNLVITDDVNYANH